MEKIVFSSEYFSPIDTLTCGQIFRFKEYKNGYLVFSNDKICYVYNNLDNVVIDSYDGLLAEYTKKVGAGAIVKGLRAMSDFEYEFQMALTNKKLNPETETLFLTTKAENMYLSSSMVKQIAAMGGDISDFVPPVIHKAVLSRLNRKDGK